MKTIKKFPFDQERLRQLFRYDDATGNLIWRKRNDAAVWWNSKYAGNIAGSPNSQGRLQVGIKRRYYLVSRIVYAYFFGFPELPIDHINGDRKDNRIQNLRMATNSQNSHNRGATINSKTGVKGVYPENGKYRAQMKINGKQKHIGYFETIEAAKAARDQYSLRKIGEFHHE